MKRIYFAVLVVLLVYLFTPSVFAQDSEPALASDAEVEEAAPAEPEIPASQEVEINEDNYRQFMELRDANRQRDIIPEDVFKPDTGLQKLQKLPEESQKHLRNQLREVISQGDEWQPGDEETEYPYTPSEAASTDPSLAKQELEAWGELVDGYNQREAQIYENSSGTRSAMGTENGTSENPGNSAGSPNGGGQSGEGSQGQQNGQENNPDQNDSAGTYSPNASNDSNSDNTAGVSQNAKEFLQGLGKAGGNAGDGDSETPAENGGQGESPTPSETGSQTQIGQQDSSSQESATTSGSAGTARDPNARSTAGTSQNAMEFLKSNSGQGDAESEDSTATSQTGQGQGETQADEQNVAQADGQDAAQSDGQDEGQAQDGQQTEATEKSVSTPPPASTSLISTVDAEKESIAGASQNALDYLTGGSVQTDDGVKGEPDTTQQEGTLTIQDLLNAQGISNSTGTAPASTNPDEEQQPDEAKLDKDGGG